MSDTIEQPRFEGFNLVGFIMEYEAGELDEATVIIEGFQHLVNTGLAWSLQGSYGRTAVALIEAGLVTDPSRMKDERPPISVHKIGTRCECGAPWDVETGGYACAK